MKTIVKTFDNLNQYELYEILKHRINVFIVEQNCPYPECDDKDKVSLHMVLKDNDNFLAYLRILPPNISYTERSIGRVLVNKDFRKAGYGKKLIQVAIDYIEKNFQEKSIRISAQKYLEKFYTNFGFVSVSKYYLEDGIPHVEMLRKSTK